MATRAFLWLVSLVVIWTEWHGLGYGVYGASENENRRISQAAAEGVIDQVMTALSRGADIDYRDETFGLTPLMWAIRGGHRAIYDALLKRRADPFCWSHRGDQSALLLAIHQRDQHAVEALFNAEIQHSRETSKCSEEKYGPLHPVEEEDDDDEEDANEEEDVLLAGVYVGGNNSKTQVREARRAALEASKKAAKENKKKESKQQMKTPPRPAPPSLVLETNQRGDTPLHVAAYIGAADSVELLLKYGGDPLALTIHDWTPFHLAAARGHVEVLQILYPFMDIEEGTLDEFHKKNEIIPLSIDRKDDHGRTPLSLACISGSLASADWLLRQGAILNSPDSSGITPLFHAVRQKHEDIVALLLSEDASIFLPTQSSQEINREEVWIGLGLNGDISGEIHGEPVVPDALLVAVEITNSEISLRIARLIVSEAIASLIKYPIVLKRALRRVVEVHGVESEIYSFLAQITPT